VALHTDERLAGLALCAGVGGLEIGVHIAEPGYRTVCFVEREAFAAATLVARMGDAALDRAPVWDDLVTFEGRPWRGKVSVVTGGYPCQPFSFSGLRRGEADPRHPWPQIRRIVGEIRPEWCFFENVEGHLTLGAAEVFADLSALDYTVKAGLFSAIETGAAHVRRRLFILAHANAVPLLQSDAPGVVECRPEDAGRPDADRFAGCHRQGSETVDHDLHADQSLRCGADETVRLPLFAPAPFEFDRWHQVLARRPDLQPELFGLADGLADRVDRAFAAGNGVVNLAAAYAWRTLKAACQ
jgi:DNA (cytosine-5)-methyltransferase 1